MNIHYKNESYIIKINNTYKITQNQFHTLKKFIIHKFLIIHENTLFQQTKGIHQVPVY